MSGGAGGGRGQRPEFMAVLGLLPPYAVEDVREAYRQRALTAHPDRGGDAAEFNRLSEAYDRAIEYVTFQGDRRAWIATRVECHLLQEEVAAEVRRRKGQVEFERMDWVKESWGEGFELLGDQLRWIRVRRQTDADTFLEFLSGRRLPYLIGLDLAGSKVTDVGLSHVASSPVLQWLDLAETGVTYTGLRQVMRDLPSLNRLNLKGTAIGWLRRRSLQRTYPGVRIVVETPGSDSLFPKMPVYVPLADRPGV
jgi:hypothetical protein